MAERIGLSAIFEVDAFSQGLSVYLRGTAQAEAATSRTASAMNSAGVGIAAGFGAAMGTVAVQAIQSFVSSTASALESAFGLASAFEQLEFSIRALNASQELLGGSTEDFTTIFAAQKEVAQGNLLLLQDLAIPSIFTTQQLASAQQMFQTFSFGRETAFELTKSLTDFATAGNLSAERMGRIAYAMSQVQGEGRLLATEVRQFAQAGIPIIDILATKLGKTAGQVREDMKEGLLTADVVFPILMDYFDNFAGVTGEAEKTLRGMFSALQDVKEISVANFMRSALEPIVPVFKQIIDFITDERIRAGATALGELLGPHLASLLQNGITALQNMVLAVKAISPETATFFALLAGGAIVLTSFAAAAGIISLAIGLLVTPFTLAVAAVSTFVAAYATNFGNLNTITNNVVNAVTSTISNAIGGFNDFASGIADALNSAAQSMGNFLGQVADWGANIVSTLAEGITSAVSVVVDAIGVLASAISYLMAPGSPPRMLPKLTEWGKSTAEEWLHGWTQADFSILNDITNFVETALGKGASSDELIKVNETIAQAVHEIRNVGYVSEDTFSQIQSSLGDASDEVFGYLERYEELASATNILEHAQEKLNQTTQHYDNLISPLKQKLDAASEAVTRAKEATELKGLEILLNTAGVSDTRKAEALARIQQINARQQVSDLETQKQAAVDKIQTEIDGATKLQETAQNQLDLFQQRIQLQNEFIALIEKEQDKASSGASKAAKAQKEGLTALEKQLKIIQLQQAELQDMIAAAKARKVLEDENSTAAQKTAAQLELQAIATRRQLRDIEAAKLGTTLDTIRQIQIVAADLEKPGKGDGKLAGLASEFEVLSNADPEGRLAQFRTKVEELKASFETMGTSIQEAASKANANLPVFLRFFNEPGTSGPPPLIANLTAALTGLAAFKFASITAGLLGLGPAGAAAAIGIGLFTAAFQGDWFGIRDDVIEVVETIRTKFQELISIFSQGFGGGQISSTSDQLRGTADPIEQLAFKMGEAAKKIIEDVGKIGPAFIQLQTDLNSIFSGEGTFFSKLTEGAQAISDAFGENSSVMLALTAFTTFMGVTFAPLLAPAVTALGTLLGPIGLAALAIVGLGIAWENNIGGIRTFTEQNFPAIASVITTAIDDISVAFKHLFNAIGSLFGGDFGDSATSLSKGFESLGGGLGKAVGGVGKIAGDLLAQIDVAKITAGITATIVTVIKSAFDGVTSFLVEGLAALTKGGEGGSALENIVSALTQAVLGAVAGIFIGLYNFLTVENIVNGIKNMGSLTISILQGIKQAVFGIFKGIASTVDQLFGTELTPQIEAISATIDKAWEGVRGVFNSIISSIRQVFLGELKAVQGPQGPFEGFQLAGRDMLAIGPLVETLEKLKTFIQNIMDTIQEFFQGIKWSLGIYLTGISIVATSLPGIVDLFSQELDKIKEKLDLAITKIKDFLSNPFGSLFGGGAFQPDMGGGDIGLGNLNPFTVSGTNVLDTIKGLFSAVEGEKIGSDLAGGIQTGYTTKIQEGAYAPFTDPLPNIIQQMANKIGAHSASTLSKSMVGVPIGLGIIMGVIETLNLQKPVLATVITLLLENMTTTLITAQTQMSEQVKTLYSTLRTSINLVLFGMQTDAIFFQTQTVVGWGLWSTAMQAVVLATYSAVSASTSAWTADILTQHTNLRTNISMIQAGMLLDSTLFQTNSVTAWTGWTTNVQTLIRNLYALLNTDTITFSTDMQTKYTTLQSSLQSTVSSMTRIVTSLFSQMHSAVNRELSKMIEDILSKLAQLLEDIREDFVNEGEELGTDFAQGIVQGMLDHIDEIRKAAEKLAQEAVKAAQESLAAKSPSEVTEKKVGGAFGQGAALGVLRSIPQALSAVNQLVDSMVSQAGYALDSSARSYGSSNSTVNNSKHYHLNVQSAQQSRGIVYDYGIMQLMEGS